MKGCTWVDIQGCNDALAPEAWVDCIGRVYVVGWRGILDRIRKRLLLMPYRGRLKILFAGHGLVVWS